MHVPPGLLAPHLPWSPQGLAEQSLNSLCCGGATAVVAAAAVAATATVPAAVPEVQLHTTAAAVKRNIGTQYVQRIGSRILLVAAQPAGP